MSHEKENKALLRQFYEKVYVHWNMEWSDQVLSNQFTSHDWPEGTPMGPQGFRMYYDSMKKAVPDVRYEVEDLIGEEDKVVVRWVMQGSYQAAFPGIDIPPVGQPFTLKGIAIYRVQNGKLMERWVVSDLHGLLEALRQKRV